VAFSKFKKVAHTAGTVYNRVRTRWGIVRPLIKQGFFQIWRS